MFTFITKQTSVVFCVFIALIITSCNNTAQGRIIFQSNQEGNFKLHIMDSDGHNRQNLVDYPESQFPPSDNNGFVPSPDGKHIAFYSDMDGNFEIYSIDVEGRSLINLTRHEANDTSFAWSPNGERIAFTSDRDARLTDADLNLWRNDIYIMDSDGENIQRLTMNNKSNSFGTLSWSPDGQKLVASMSSSRSNPGGLHVSVIASIDIKSGDPVILTSPSGAAQSSPLWSPDQNRILYLDGGSSSNNIHVINADGKGEKVLSVDSTGWITTMSWSPDGNTILFSSYNLEKEHYSIYTVNIDGTNLKTLTEKSNYDTSPSWSPNGSQIVFASNRDGKFHLYIMNSDGTDQKRLTDVESEEASPIWIP